MCCFYPNNRDGNKPQLNTINKEIKIQFLNVSNNHNIYVETSDDGRWNRTVEQTRALITHLIESLFANLCEYSKNVPVLVDSFITNKTKTWAMLKSRWATWLKKYLNA
jgi:hypothetical protein